VHDVSHFIPLTCSLFFLGVRKDHWTRWKIEVGGEGKNFVA
jgi:hypothetical protein